MDTACAGDAYPRHTATACHGKAGCVLYRRRPEGLLGGLMGGWWPQIGPVAGGPAESPIFSLRLWHACMSAFRRPETPSGALNEHKTKTAD